MRLSYINGTAQQLDVSHRGLAYGDGLFETIFVDRKGPRFLADHLARLNLGVIRLGLLLLPSQILDLKNLINEHCTNLSQNHSLKIMVLRNYPGRGYDFDPATQTTDVVFQLEPYLAPSWIYSGASVVIAPTGISENKSLAGIKHLNRLDSVLARREARRRNASDALMLDSDGHIVESSMGNVFFKISNQWITPSLFRAGVNGIVRQKIIQLASSISMGTCKVDRLDQIQSAFLTNSLIGIVPIIELEGRALIKDAEYIHSISEKIF